MKLILLFLPVILNGAQATLSYQAGPDVPQAVVSGAAPGNRVEFFDGVTLLGPAAVGPDSHASLPLRSLSPGAHTLLAKERSTGALLGHLINVVIPAAPGNHFSVPTGYPFGIRPVVFASGTLDHNRTAVVGAGDGYLAVLRSSAAGFAAPLILTALATPTAIAVADFDGDGSGDIAVASASGEIAIFLNDGTGGFRNPSLYASGVRPSGLAIADFNGDGVLDLAVASSSGHQIALLTGKTNGTFNPAVPVEAGLEPRTILAADLNGDGFADLAVADFTTNTVSVLKGDGRGSFEIAESTRVGNGPSVILAVDFNDDGATDLAVLNQLDRTAVILINDGSGKLSAGLTMSDITSLTAGHITGSAHMDLLIQRGASLEIFAGAGDGSFHPGQVLAGSTAPQSIFLADYNQDGQLDLAFADLSGVLSVSAGSLPAAASSAGLASVGAASVSTPARAQAHAHVVGNVASSITLVSSNTSSNLGQASTLTATITPSGASGAVTFYDGATILAVVPSAAGQSLFTTSRLPSGINSLKARYAGDSTYAPSISSAVTQTVTVLPQSGFVSAASYGGGAVPHAVVSADFNNDGIADIATAANAGASVEIFLGRGNGAFAAGVPYPAGTQPFGMVAVDLNGDGITDLAVTNADASTVTVLLGIAGAGGVGTGTFATGVAYATGPTPQSVAAGDFNGDGAADLVVANFGSASVTVLLGNGDGTLQTGVPYTVGTSPAAVAVGDFDGDGNPDVATANSGSANISVLLGSANGTLQAAVNYAAGNQPTSIVAADLNGDGLVDLAVANALTAGVNVGVFLNKTTAPGTFNARATATAGNTPRFITVGDFNSDGVQDLLVVNKGTGPANSTFSVLTGTGTGTFHTATTTAVGNLPWAAVVGDFNGDGRSDVAIASSSDNKLYVLLGSGLYSNLTVASVHSGNFTQGQTGATYALTVSNVGLWATSGVVTVTDTLPAGLTGSGISGSGWTCDLGAMSCTRSDSLPVGQNYPDVTVTFNVASNAALTVTNFVTVSGGGEINTSDDATTDPATVSQTTSIALTSSLNPSFTGTSIAFTATVSSTGATGFITFYDGFTPLATVALSAGQAILNTALLNSGPHVLLARYNGDTQYLPGLSSPLPQTVSNQLQNGFQSGVNYSSVGATPSGVAIADFNGDGHADLAVSTASGTGKVAILLGRGDGTFQTAATYTGGGTSSAPAAIVSADFNGDGLMDVAMANNGTNNVSVLLGNGDGSFRASINTPAGNHPQYLAAADFNGDGTIDLAVADAGSGVVSILLGTGTGGFQAAPSNVVGTNPRSLVVGDFNRDGSADLAVANFGSNTVTILFGKNDGTFQAPVTYAVGTNPQSVISGDFNGDGFADLAVANNGSSSVSVLLGNGDGTFGTALSYAAGTNPTAVLTGDFSGDGIPDLAVTNAGGASLLLGVGDGTFQNPSSYTAGTAPVALASADFDGDGTSDLAVANQGSANVTVLLGGLYYSDVTIAKSHLANFTQGQTGAQYSLAVSNVGQNSTAGTVTATDVLPKGMTATSISGTGWACVLGTLSCTRNDALAAGGTYPVVTVAVTVAGSAAAQLTNTAKVSGGHENNPANNNASDLTNIIQLTNVTLTAASPWVYGQAVTLTATVSQTAATGTITFFQGSTTLGVVSLSGGVASLPAPALTPGSYAFSAVYTGDPIYAGSTGTLSQTVDKASVIVTLSGTSATWDGTPKAVSVVTNPAGLTFAVTYNGSPTPPSNAGTYPVLVVISDPNYAGSASASLTIARSLATVTLSGLTATYDGTPKVATASTSPAGLAVNITYGNGASAPINAGTYGVSATVTDPNYIGNASGTLVLSAAPVTISLTNLSAFYNGAQKPVSATTTPPGIAVAITYNGSASAPIAAGSYSVVAISADANHTGTASATLNVLKANATFALGNLITTYDGTPKAPAITSTPGGVGFTVSYDGGSVPPVNAGSHSVVVTANDTNYAGMASATLTIQRATPVAAWAPPAAMTFGTALTITQLNATATAAGTFSYSPAAGTVLPLGAGQSLSAVFIPSDSVNYNSASTSTTITVNPGTATGVSMITSKILGRDSSNNVVVQLILSNNGKTDAANVVIASAKIGTITGTPVAVNIGATPAGTSAEVTFLFPASAMGAPGFSTTWSLSGTFTGGAFSSAGRINLP